MAEVMLTFGDLPFSVSGAVYQALRRATAFRLAAQERIGVRPGYHFTGPGEESITLSGVIMPTYRGRPAMLDDLRALAGESRKLTSGTGEDLGRWMIAELNEEQSALFDNGKARKVVFTARLLRDEDEPSGRLDGLERRSAAQGDVGAVLDATRAAVAGGQDSAGVIAAAEGAL